MVSETSEFHLNGNSPEQSAEELEGVFKTLKDIKRGDGQLVSLGKQDVGLLKQFAHIPEKLDTAQQYLELLVVADFKDEREMWKHLNAFEEAVRLGTDLRRNIRLLAALPSINRGGHRSSRVAMIMDTLSHQKFTQTGLPNKGGKQQIGSNPRSPLS